MVRMRRNAGAFSWARAMMSALRTMDEVAEELRVSRRWLQDFLVDHPYYREVGRKKLFTPEDIVRLIGALPCPGSSSRRAPGKTSVYYVRGKYLGIGLDHSTGTSNWEAAKRI